MPSSQDIKTERRTMHPFKVRESTHGISRGVFSLEPKIRRAVYFGCASPTDISAYHVAISGNRRTSRMSFRYFENTAPYDTAS